MKRRTESMSLRGAIACVVLAVIALSLGPSGESFVRSSVRDAALPGFLVNRWLADRHDVFDLHRWPWSADRTDALVHADSKIDMASHQELRRLRAELATARHDLAAFRSSLGPVRARESTELPPVERIPARILDDTMTEAGAGGLILASGVSNGAANDQIAVEPALLTAGESIDVTAGAAVLTGAAVLGRTAEVGLWTSTILPVTSPEFRAHVRIVRETPEGPVQGEDGILEGDGRDGCVVKYVPSTAAVAIGDHVYSFDPTGRMPQPLYYGSIAAAELPEGAPHWRISVRPAADAHAFSEVHILRPIEHDRADTHDK